MMRLLSSLALPVRILTLVVFFLPGCSLLNRHFTETCKTHAYVHAILADYLKTRFPSKAPVRTAIIPFSVPANLAGQDNENLGMGYDLAVRLKAELLSNGQLPIVELLNRQDWPGKKEEFHSGNYGAITYARDAGYDLVIVGNVDAMKSLDTLSAETKIIEVESGTTIWYGKSSAASYRPEVNYSTWSLTLTPKRPDMIPTEPLTEKLSVCMMKAITAEKPLENERE